MTTGAFKRGWGGHGMPLNEISNDPIPPYTWTGAPPPAEKNFVPDLHFVEISQDRRVYIGERGQNRIEVFTPEGSFCRSSLSHPTRRRAVTGAAGSTTRRCRRAAPPTSGHLARSRAEVSICCGWDATTACDPRPPERQDAGIVRRQRPLCGAAPLDQRDRDRLEGQHLHRRGGAGQAHPEVRAGAGSDLQALVPGSLRWPPAPRASVQAATTR